MGVNTDYPSINSYAEAKAFHDATKLNRHGNRWPSQTKVKHMFTCNGDGSIAFKLYDTEGVIEHETLQMLTMPQYERYLKMSKRF